MNEWAGVFLGVIALAAVVQCVFIVLAARSILDTTGRLQDLSRRFDQELKPVLDDLRAGAANLRAISATGREQAARIESVLSTILESVETTVESVREMVLKPLESLSELSAFWGGLRRGIDAYRSAGPRRPTPPVPSRRSEDSDEHMFIG